MENLLPNTEFLPFWYPSASTQVLFQEANIYQNHSRLALLPYAADAVREVSALQGRAVGLADSVRRLSHDLHPSMLERVGLIAALSDHCAEIERLQLLAVAFTAEGDFSTIAPDSAWIDCSAPSCNTARENEG